MKESSATAEFARLSLVVMAFFVTTDLALLSECADWAFIIFLLAWSLTPLRMAGNLITCFMMLTLTVLILKVGNWILGFMLLTHFRQDGRILNQVFMNECLFALSLSPRDHLAWSSLGMDR